MTADILREAAALMRERAEAATPGPWSEVGDGELMGCCAVVAGGDDEFNVAPAVIPSNAEHIAAADPPFVLAVADGLIAAAADIWAHGPLCGCSLGCDDCDDALWEPHARRALATARAYRGES